MIKFIYYKAKDGWRWRAIRKGSAKIVAESGEAYARKYGVRRAALKFATALTTYGWKIEEGK